MEELNTMLAVETFEEAGSETLTAIDMGDMFSLSQVTEDRTFHNIVIGLDQAIRLKDWMHRVLNETHH